MAVHFIDSVVFQDSVGIERMRKAFDETTMFQRWLDVERAIALAEGELGMISKSAAARIAECAKVENIDLDTVKAHGKVTTHSLMGLLKEFRRAIDHEDARYVHWGATTQDIIDTGLMLMIRDAYDIVEDLLSDVLRHGRPLLAAHRDTMMAGRTHGGQALPITFGLKAAIWLDELVRQLQRWRAARERILVVNIVGAVGTFASWGKSGFELQRLAADILGLGIPLSPWSSARDRMAEAVTLCALTAGTASRIAKEVYNLGKTEVRELEEAFSVGKIGSTTMPHKHNPVRAEWTIVLDRLIRANAGVALEAMGVENERDATHWKAEWIVVPETFVLLSGALNHLSEILGGLQVNADRMARNTEMLKGLLMSERAMFVVAEHLPLPDAHQAVYEASVRAYDKDTLLIDELMTNCAVAGVCERRRIEEALDPRTYLGLAGEITDRVASEVDSVLAETDPMTSGETRATFQSVAAPIGCSK